MVHSKFISLVEDLGFKVFDLRYYDYISIHDEHGEVAWVSKDNLLVLGSEGLIRLSIEVRETLFDILVEYARTPIEDREEG